jgi:Flp pilus assembly pilin Flp
MLLSLSVCIHAALVHLLDAGRRRFQRDQRGQASAEYALVLLGAAAVALLIVAWATKTDLIEKLFDKVLKAITGKVQ